MSFIKFIFLELFEVNRAVIYALSVRLWGFINVLITLIMVTTYFSPNIQGYYYTFASILLLQILIELGFGTVLVQFISHEWAQLSLNNKRQIAGMPTALSRLKYLIKLGIYWYLLIALIVICFVGTLGYLFLTQKNEPNIIIGYPWWFFCTTVSFSIVIVPLRCFLEGSNQVAKVQYIDLITNVSSSVIGWLAIMEGSGLYALGVISLIKFVVGFFLLLPATTPFLKLLGTPLKEHQLSWKKDFWPLQWRIGVSWLSGYFMFNIFVPLMFYLHGPLMAGKMGAALQIYNGVHSISYSWIAVSAPQFGILGAQKAYTEIKTIVKNIYLKCLIISIACTVLIIITIVIMNKINLPQTSRLPDMVSIALLLITIIALQLPNVETIAIRFQKTEPFVLNSIVSALMVFCISYVLGRHYAIRGVAVGFFLIIVGVTIPWCHYIYNKEMFKLSLSSVGK